MLMHLLMLMLMLYVAETEFDSDAGTEIVTAAFAVADDDAVFLVFIIFKEENHESAAKGIG